MNFKPILIVPGERKSIFFEIFFKSLKLKKIKSPLVLICNKKIFYSETRKYKFKNRIEIVSVEKIFQKQFKNKKIYLINISNQKSNSYVQECFKLAFKLIKDGFSNKLINGPINKSKTLKKKYLGITEYVAKNFKQKKFAMLIYNKKLSVCPLTTHLPLKQVPKNVTKKLISEKIDLIDNFYKKQLGIKAKIGVTGLNPHCESVNSFNEDEKIIPLIIKNKRKKGINVKGPFSSDTIFLKKNREKFDIILGMYHDQVIGPIKTLFEYDAINITMGLPILRVSPDHGPNIQMFKKNKSNPLSLIKALNFLDKK